MNIKIKINGNEVESDPAHIAILIRSLGRNLSDQQESMAATVT